MAANGAGPIEGDKDIQKLPAVVNNKLVKELTDVIVKNQASCAVEPHIDGDPVHLATVVMGNIKYVLLRAPKVYLTKKQILIIQCLGAGLINKEIAGILGNRTTTIKWNVEHLIGKLKVGSRAGLARLSVFFPDLTVHVFEPGKSGRSASTV